MLVSTTDPITLKDVIDPENHPYVIEGKGDNALKIYFEDESTKSVYLGIEVDNSGNDFTINLDNSKAMGGEGQKH